MLMKMLKCSNSWALDKDHLCTQQTYKASMEELRFKSFRWIARSGFIPSPSQMHNLARFLSHKWKIGYEACPQVSHRTVWVVLLAEVEVTPVNHSARVHYIQCYRAVSLPSARCMKFKQIWSCCVGNEKPDSVTFPACTLCFLWRQLESESCILQKNRGLPICIFWG